MKKLILILFLILFVNSFSQIYEDKDVKICKSKFELAATKKMSIKPIGDVIVDIGKSFIGTKYQASTLEKDGDEQLVINLTGFDCTTFLENCLAFARCIKQNKTTFDDYQKELIKIRYRYGVINRYPSRLHYFSDWIYSNSLYGIVKDITQSLGGVPIQFKVEYMSKNPDNYKHLKENPDFIPIIQKQEEEINKRTYYFIPKERVQWNEDKIENGDLIAITTDIDGLDISHVGIAVKVKDRIYFMHAHLTGGKVQISENPLADYLAKIKKHTGIIVLRALEPVN